MQRDTSKSDQIVQKLRQSSFQSARKSYSFSGTWEATPDEIFPLLCPAREADWIPGWDCDLVYTKSGLAEDNCIFKTDESCSVGEGLWMFIGYEVNDYIEFVRMNDNVVTRARVTVTDNQNGTVSATWDVLLTGLTEQGNAEVEKANSASSAGLLKMVDHYLKTGKAITRAAMVTGVVADRIHGHFS
jgi:hypothetical protein